jgi:hypothetical protein
MLIIPKRDAEGSALVGDADEQVQAFATLLRAIYRMPIEIYSVKHLEITTELADYYRALPKTSKAVTSSLLDSRAFTTTIPENCVKLLEVSRKLRNKVLFKECLIHCTGPWRRPKYLLLKDLALKELCETAYQRILQKIGIFFQELLENVPSSHRESLQELAMTLLQTAPSYTYSVSQGDMARMNLPQYFRNLQKSLANKFAVSSQIKEGLKRLLHSELRLDQSGCFPGEAGIFASFFLCAVIKDSELPWDDNEMNW